MRIFDNPLSLKEIVGGGYDEFWRDERRYRILKGGKGSKKSTTAALNFIFRLIKYKDSNLLVVRQVMDTHRNSTFAQLRWAAKRLGVEHLFKFTVSPMEITYLPTGQKILFRGFDDVLKLASTTVDTGYLCWVWIEEAFEIPSEADFDKLDLSVPRGSISKPLFKQTTITFNPWSENHWLKKRFFDSCNDTVGTYSTNYLCNEFLDDTDRAVFERMRLESPRKYAVAGLGDWGISEGLVFEKWRIEPFEKDKLGIEIENGEATDDSWKYCHIFGLDYGYTNDPTAFIAAAVNPIDKLCYIYDEHYEKKMLNSQIAEMIYKKGFSKEMIFADSSEPKSNDELRRLGITRLRACKKGPDSIRSGIAQIQEYTIIVLPSCANTIAELSSYCWEKSGTGGKNKPQDTNNHLMDALRYAFGYLQFFHPQNPKAKNKAPKSNYYGGISPQDILKGWI